MATRVIPVDVFDLVIFGGTGDLARRKIIPGLYRRFMAGQMPVGSRIIGAARADLDDAAYRKLARNAIKEFVQAESQDKAKIDDFVASLHYFKIDATGEAGWKEMAKIVRKDVVQAF